MKVFSKVVWSILALLCILSLAYIWLIGLPNKNYVASYDEKPSVLYTVRTGPATFFDVYMSEDEYLLQTDFETTYLFENASITKSSTSSKAELIDADKQVYGRPGSFCYRKFNDLCTITIDSKLSTYQGLQSLVKGDEYSVETSMSEMKLLDSEQIPFVDPLTPFYFAGSDIRVAKGTTYDYKEDTGSMIAYGEMRKTFYKASTVYGLSSDVTNQLLATAKACYKLDLKEYFAGEDYMMWIDGDWVIGIRNINRNTQLVVATNAPEQRDAAIVTITKG